MTHPRLLLTGLLLATVPMLHAQDRQARQKARMQKDRNESDAAGNWIYNDLDKAVAQARKDDKPLLVIFRCIP